MHYAICNEVALSLLPNVMQGQKSCIMTFMHCDVMHYEMFNCTSLYSHVTCARRLSSLTQSSLYSNPLYYTDYKAGLPSCTWSETHIQLFWAHVFTSLHPSVHMLLEPGLWWLLWIHFHLWFGLDPTGIFLGSTEEEIYAFAFTLHDLVKVCSPSLEEYRKGTRLSTQRRAKEVKWIGYNLH